MALSTGKFVLGRVLSVVIVIVGVTGLTWLAVNALRPDLRAGDDRFILIGLVDYLQSAFLHFDFGVSRTGNREVQDLIRQGLPADLSLLAGGLAIGLLTGIAGGAYCAARPNTLPGARARGGRGAGHVRTGLRRRPDVAAVLRGRARDGGEQRPGHPHDLHPVPRQPAGLGGLAAGALDRARPAAGRRLPADDAGLDERGAGRGLPPHREGEGPEHAHRRAPPRGARPRSRRCSA